MFPTSYFTSSREIYISRKQFRSFLEVKREVKMDFEHLEKEKKTIAWQFYGL